jgi:EAL domain-containing protein (putative c-di-GMP-specific phosphodiesterase class I)
MLFQNAEAVRESVRDLQAAGVKIAIDDFGTGYSSLSYLKQFRVNKLKIDRSFIRDLPGDRDDEVITQAIIGMAKSLNLTVIAEGVETDEQMAFLKDHACDQIQGYWYSKPTSPEEIANKLQAHLAAAD